LPTTCITNGCSSFTIWRTLHEQGLHPYHLQRAQRLKPEDPPRRIAFCQWLLQKIDEEPSFLSIVLTTDEAGFTRDGVFNSHNTHIWSEENPHQIRERGLSARGVKNWLDANLENQWIGCNGPVLWPARSPDLNPCDFFEDLPISPFIFFFNNTGLQNKTF
jgi:hypothetical protein